jgi:hypothetical protein
MSDCLAKCIESHEHHQSYNYVTFRLAALYDFVHDYIAILEIKIFKIQLPIELLQILSTRYHEFNL